MITIIKSPLIESKLGILRNKNTSGKNFRRSMDEISYLIAAEVAKSLIYKKKKIITPLKKTTILEINQKIVLVPILRAGLGLLEGFIKLIPESECGHIGLYRDEETYKPVEYLCKFEKFVNEPETRRMNGSTFDGIHKTEITHAAVTVVYDPFDLGWSKVICGLIG